MVQEPQVVEVDLPACLALTAPVDRNRAQQIVRLPESAVLESHGRSRFAVTEAGARYRVLAAPRALEPGEWALRCSPPVLRSLPPRIEASDLRWFGDVQPSSPQAVLTSLIDSFNFVEEAPAQGRAGLRLPQLGALHAVLGYWTTDAGSPATVVMPTGTGKTEAMVALFAAARLPRLLVVVPSDALRKQIADKFAYFGVLQTSQVIDTSALRPIVGQVDHRFSDADAARRFSSGCNVLVTTPNALFAARSPGVTDALLDSCSHLFVDEAHHVEAKTWRQIRDSFGGKPVLQFTATPFREDGRRLAGRQVYRFGLRQAQDRGYFSPIDYSSVIDLADQDRAVASKAVARLRADLAADLDHVVMARVRTIRRAEEMQALYADLAPDLNPVVLHSTMAVRDRTASLAELHARRSRIITCVDMLGEGFDLPSLKVAAIHDPFKSLGITLQFVGRFARVAGETVGRAAVFVARPDLKYDHSLRRLYSEDADWNAIISELTEDAIGEQEAIGDFEAGFSDEPDEVSVRSLAPKMSTVVYRTSVSDWRPERVTDIHPEETLLTNPPPINLDAHVTWFVVKNEAAVKWGDLPTVEEVTYDLYVLYWDATRRLLYINSSNTDTVHGKLAKAVCGDDVSLIRDTDVYRAMHGVERLIPTNVGVLDVLDRDRRFSFFAGANVIEGFATAEAETKTQTNIFGSGFEDGERVTIGASLKGRVWSYQAADTLKHWIDWCDHVGPKLADEGISVDAVIGSFILPQRLDRLPELVPIALEWPVEIALSASDETRVEHDGVSWPLVDVELRVADFTAGGPIRFAVNAPNWTVAYTADIINRKLRYQSAGNGEVYVRRGRREPVRLGDYLESRTNGPLILFEQEAMVVGDGILVQPDRQREPFSRDDLQVLDWSGVDIRKESQGRERMSDSIQHRTIRHILGRANWDVVLDDDGTNEVADIVALRADGAQLHVLLVHCKYSSADNPGARVKDLYEVCGQVQKSVQSRVHLDAMFQRLIKRERDRVRRHGHSGFERGDIQMLYRLYDEAQLLRPAFTIAIAQPGLSKARVPVELLHILAGSEVYVRDVAKAPLEVFCSS